MAGRRDETLQYSDASLYPRVSIRHSEFSNICKTGIGHGHLNDFRTRPTATHSRSGCHQQESVSVTSSPAGGPATKRERWSSTGTSSRHRTASWIMS